MKSTVFAALVASALLVPSPVAAQIGWGGYSLVRANQARSVGDGSMVVTPPREWNRKSTAWVIDDVRQVEDWTLNGNTLDSMSFVSGLKGGRYIIRQNRRDAQQVPKFRSDMTAPTARPRRHTSSLSRWSKSNWKPG